MILAIDILAILQKSLDRALFLYNFVREIQLSGVRASITIMHIRKFFKLNHNAIFSAIVHSEIGAYVKGTKTNFKV